MKYVQKLKTLRLLRVLQVYIVHLTNQHKTFDNIMWVTKRDRSSFILAVMASCGEENANYLYPVRVPRGLPYCNYYLLRIFQTPRELTIRIVVNVFWRIVLLIVVNKTLVRIVIIWIHFSHECVSQCLHHVR